MQDVRTIARDESDGFEVALRRRGSGPDAVDELIVNGAFAMDSAETASEIALADALGTKPGRVLVGGLGLGYTATRLLENGATTLDVVELSSALLQWAQDGLTDTLGRLAKDPRVTFHHGDVGDLLEGQPTIPGVFGPWDSIALDVDNGPDFLIHGGNQRVYTPRGLAAAMQHLVPGGKLVIWSHAPSPRLWVDLLHLDPQATELLVPVRREGREFDYAVYVARRLS